MAFHTPSEEPEAMSDINVTPLVDVMLVLLVIFIVTAPLLSQALRVNLPKTPAVSPSPMPRKPAQLAIDAQGGLHLNQQAIGNSAQLEAALKGALERDPDLLVELHADQNVAYHHIARAMAAAQRAGITKLSFATVAE